jgi:hypothetical protein
LRDARESDLILFSQQAQALSDDFACGMVQLHIAALAGKRRDSISLMQRQQLRMDGQPPLFPFFRMRGRDDSAIEHRHRSDGKLALFQSFDCDLKGLAHIMFDFGTHGIVAVSDHARMLFANVSSAV